MLDHRLARVLLAVALTERAYGTTIRATPPENIDA